MAMEKLIQASQDSNDNGLDAIIVGQTPAMVELKRHILNLGKTDLTVLITGESGTGKELVARALHKCSPRADRPFVKVTIVLQYPRTSLRVNYLDLKKGPSQEPAEKNWASSNWPTPERFF
jgi:DNA-binding NtrC family response regulator